METNQSVQPFCGAFVFVEAGSNAGLDSHIQRTASAYHVGEVLLEGPNVVAAHPLIGPADLLVLLKADNPEELLQALHRQVRDHRGDNLSFVTGTHSHIITSSYGQPFTRETFEKTDKVSAWVMGTVGQSDPADFIAEHLLESSPEVKCYAPVLGVYDFFLFLQASDFSRLQHALDHTVRKLRHFIATDTRLVLWSTKY